MTEFFAKYFPNVVQLGWSGDSGWGTSIGQTLYMTFWPAVFGGILGMLFGVILVVTKPGGIMENRTLFSISDKIVSLFRAIPFIILLFCLLPLTRLISGTAIGVQGSIVPLVFGTVPFLARQMELN